MMRARGRTTVLVVDDHPLVRAGLTALLNATERIEVLGEAADGREAVDLACRMRPDVVLMDLSMPVLDGIEATRQIAELAPDVRVVVLTSFADSRRVADAMAAGAAGYLLKDCDTDDTVAAVGSAPVGGAPIDPRVVGVLRARRSTGSAAAGGGLHRLTAWSRRGTRSA